MRMLYWRTGSCGFRRECRGCTCRSIPSFTSLAQAQGSRAIGVVLSGDASDGSQGVRMIKGEFGLTFAQDEGSGAP